ncbi:CPBP family glutamic-type intramembrane protease [Brevundimonas variabilis]|nr:CPBP family glutamic-type intramembrane protease [Brevundimonas variabilis]
MEPTVLGIAAVLTALIGPALAIAVRDSGPVRRTGWVGRLCGAVVLWGVAGLALWLGSRAVGSDLLVPPVDGSALGWGLLFGAIGLATFPVQMAAAKLLRRQPAPVEAIEAIAAVPLPGRIFLLLTAGLIEEVLFRAVPIILLHDLTGSLTFAVVVPLLVFVLLHRSSWGPLHLLFVALAGSVLTAAYLIGGLWAAVLAHLIIDAPLMLTARSIARRARSGSVSPGRPAMDETV